MRIMLGGPKCRAQFVFRGVVVSLQYVNDEPALVLFPRRPRPKAGAYVVPLSAAYQYDDPHYLVRQSVVAGRVLGMETRFEVMNIAQAIHDHLEDLVKMKPAPHDEEGQRRHGTLKVGGRVIEFEGPVH